MSHTLESIQLQAALALIKEMGAIIRYLDENAAHCQYWLNDGNPNEVAYVPAAIELGLD